MDCSLGKVVSNEKYYADRRDHFMPFIVQKRVGVGKIRWECCWVQARREGTSLQTQFPSISVGPLVAGKLILKILDFIVL